MLLIPQILLCGLVVSFSDLTPKSTTGNVPVMGNIIPSRWAYEALAVTSFTDNEYEKDLFELDKKKYENLYYNSIFLYELQSQLETMRDEQKNGKPVKPEHMEVIHTNLPLITEQCGVEPYQGDDSYESLHSYMKEAERILVVEGNKATLKADAQMAKMIQEIGKEGVMELKRDHCNLKLKDVVTGADQRRVIDIIDSHIVPRAGIVYLTPRSTWGHAPFYSSEKILGDWHIKTLWYNLSVMGLMIIILAILLFTDCPGRYVRKEGY
jgi:hypothetical protein